MGNRKDIEPDVLRRVRGNTAHPGNALRFAQVHDIREMRHAIEVHGVEPAEVDQQGETGPQLGQKPRNLLGASFHLRRRDMPAKAFTQKVARNIELDV